MLWSRQSKAFERSMYTFTGVRFLFILSICLSISSSAASSVDLLIFGELTCRQYLINNKG